MYRKVVPLLLSLPILIFAQNRPIVNVTDASIGPGQSVTWTADNVYLLNGFVFVEEGATLTIEAGTVIKGKPGQGENASALIIARGGKIFANGTATNPIIFTAEADDVTRFDDLPLDARGLWGGVIILGRARINVAGGEENIEG
ncbi:MAG: T9SS C-terminal target domain-containing protein, partial [candidate division KSB1 bacterium]|nr:T9SS C-terminal target domain-containing protein [candidate division KSB1 bacterium]MDZ7298443.1 T9SS C-terminal target domain-containing protein [candidate division KSB1 bacterium]MDZ7353110.1 T9SS C-terminal target domain-containing protein [candidate division KSB1 bacterium]MDZ7381118.1 T9SS C-terminal target domain-containing protein [candidate division KSB1 bacterium]MDZ7395927.1 T9SS C-terminal target domain-containing protein [candidate division KSB1 bacterium]